MGIFYLEVGGEVLEGGQSEQQRHTGCMDIDKRWRPVELQIPQVCLWPCHKAWGSVLPTPNPV